MMQILLGWLFCTLLIGLIILVAVFIGIKIVKYSRPKTKAFIVTTQVKESLRAITNIEVVEFPYLKSDYDCFMNCLNEVRKHNADNAIIDFRKI